MTLNVCLAKADILYVVMMHFSQFLAAYHIFIVTRFSSEFCRAEVESHMGFPQQHPLSVGMFHASSIFNQRIQKILIPEPICMYTGNFLKMRERKIFRQNPEYIKMNLASRIFSGNRLKFFLQCRFALVGQSQKSPRFKKKVFLARC